MSLLHSLVSLFKETLLSAPVNYTSSILELLVMQPLDTIKTRIQLTPPWHRPGGIIFYARKIYKEEGILSFWKGLTAGIIVSIPRRTVRNISYDKCVSLFTFDEDGPDYTAYALSGFVAGVLDAVIINPFEVVKIVQQLDESRLKMTPKLSKVVNEIYKSEGPGGFFKGTHVSLIRGGLFNMIVYGIYEALQQIQPIKDTEPELLRQAKIAMKTGVIVTLVVYPLDLVKSYAQSNWDGYSCCPKQFRRYSVGDIFRHIVRMQGFWAIYNGLLARLLRAPLGAAMVLLSYENLYEYLEREA